MGRNLVRNYFYQEMKTVHALICNDQITWISRDYFIMYPGSFKICHSRSITSVSHIIIIIIITVPHKLWTFITLVSSCNRQALLRMEISHPKRICLQRTFTTQKIARAHVLGEIRTHHSSSEAVQDQVVFVNYFVSSLTKIKYKFVQIP